MLFQDIFTLHVVPYQLTNLC